MDSLMAAWWKYGLCGFAGLGVGYLVGVRVTRNKTEEEYEQKIEDIREIYRSDRKKDKPAKKKQEEEPEKNEIVTRTSIDMEKLSERKERAEEALNRYSKAAPKADDSEEKSALDEMIDDAEHLPDYIHIVDEIPEDNGYRTEVLKYHSDGVLCYAVKGSMVDEQDIPEMIGDAKVLKRLDADDCNQLYIVNDQWGLNYTIVFVYEPWSMVVKEEPYKAEL